MAVKVGVDAVNAASDLNEQVSKTGVVFKGSEKGIVRWSQTTADSLGLSQTQALEAASGMGNLLVPMGVGRKTAAGMSKRMVQLAGDMASFNNASPEETLAALQSAFIGEYDPVQRFGAAITAARVESEAMRMTHRKNAKDLTAAEKAQAAYNLILKDTKDQQGDVERTSTSFANAQRRLSATWQDFLAQAGGPLLDVAAQGINSLIDPLRHVTNTARDVFADKNLNWREKLSRIGQSIKHWFGPIATQVKDAMEDALRAAAPRAANAFVNGFKNAPIWVQALTAAFVIAKLSPAFSAAGTLLGGTLCNRSKTGLGNCMGGKGMRGMLTSKGMLMGRIAGAAMVTALVAKLNNGDVGRTIESLLNPMSGTNDARNRPKPNPGGRDIGPKRPGGLQYTAPDPGPTSRGNPLGPDPIIHVTTQIDGKAVAESVARHANRKKSTR
jgi:hypothetical protein